MKGYETTGHLEADQAHLTAIGEHQSIAVDDLDHRFGLGDLQGREGGGVAAHGILALGARGGQAGGQARAESRPQDRGGESDE